MNDTVNISIVNWEESNPATVVKTPSWFRIDKNITTSELFFGESGLTKWVWICLLSKAMDHKSGNFDLNLEWAARHWDIKKSDILYAIEIFNKKGILRMSSALAPNSLRIDAALQNTTEQNRRTILSDFDFEKIYEKYPKKEGKGDGLKKLESTIKTREEFEDLEKALGNYLNYLVKEKREPKYIKQFSTWVNNWRDWKDPNAGKVILQKPISPPPQETYSDPPKFSEGPIDPKIKEMLDQIKMGKLVSV